MFFLFLSCLYLRNSVILSYTVILLINLRTWIQKLWYFTILFLVTRLSNIFYLVNLTLEIGLLFENFNFANIFWTVNLCFENLSFDILVRILFRGYQHFDLMTFTMDFCRDFENCNLSYKFSAVDIRFVIFHMNVPCDKIFLLMNLLTLTFDLFFKLILLITSK